MLKETGHSEDRGLAEELGITPERVVAELVKIAFPDRDIRHLVNEESQAAALATLACIKPDVLAACGIRITKVEAKP